MEGAIYKLVLQNFNEEQTSCDEDFSSATSTFWAVTTDPPYNIPGLEANSSKCNQAGSLSKAGIVGIAIGVAVGCVVMTLAAVYFHQRRQRTNTAKAPAAGLAPGLEHYATAASGDSAAVRAPHSVQPTQRFESHTGTPWVADDKYGVSDAVSTVPELPAPDPADVSVIWQGPGSALVNADDQVEVTYPVPSDAATTAISRLHTPSPKRLGRLSREPSFEMCSRLSDLAASPKP
jgi:hypothetical protein